MSITGSSSNDIVEGKSVRIKWSFATINPITQVIEYFYNKRKKNG